MARAQRTRQPRQEVAYPTRVCLPVLPAQLLPVLNLRLETTDVIFIPSLETTDVIFIPSSSWELISIAFRNH